jgi:hypothetical protein
MLLCCWGFDENVSRETFFSSGEQTTNSGLMGVGQVTRMALVMSKKHMGSSIDDFLEQEGIFEEAQA